MRIVDGMRRTGRSTAVRVGGIACAVALWMLVTMPAPAQNALAQNGATPNDATQAGATQEGMAQNGAGQASTSGEIIGVSRPDPSVITVTPYADGASGNATGNASMTQTATGSDVTTSPVTAPAMTSTTNGAGARPDVRLIPRTDTTTSAGSNADNDSYTATGVVISRPGSQYATSDGQGTTPGGQGAAADEQNGADNGQYATVGDQGGMAGGQSATASVQGSATFDPDASIVTTQTAGRAQRQLLSGTKIAAAANDPDAGIVMHVPSPPGEVPDGTLVKAKLRETLSTLTTRRGSLFTAELTAPVMRNGQVVVPVGSLLKGRVTMVRGGKRIGGAAAIHLEPQTITLPDGSQYALHAEVIDTNSWDDTRVDNEGTILRKDHAKGRASAIGLSAGGAMAAGAVIGGVPGALIGAGVGAGVGTVVWMRQDYQAELPKGLVLVFSLTAPMRIAPLNAQIIRPAQQAIAQTGSQPSLGNGGGE